MKRRVKLATIAVSSIVIIVFLVTVINQMTLFVDFVSSYSSWLGQAVFVLFSLMLLTLLVLPLYFLLRLPSRLPFPDPDSPDDVAEYRKNLVKSLNKNRHIQKSGLAVDERNLDEALDILDDLAHKQ